MPEPFLHLQNLVELAAIPGDLVSEAPHRNPSSSPGPSPRAGGLEMTSTFQLPIQWNFLPSIATNPIQNGARLTNSGTANNTADSIFDGLSECWSREQHHPPLINNPVCSSIAQVRGHRQCKVQDHLRRISNLLNSRADRTGMIKQQSLDLASRYCRCYNPNCGFEAL